MITQETDAELEKFIQHQFAINSGETDYGDCEKMMEEYDFKNAAHAVAAFAAKRAREKAIEEWSGKNAVEIIQYLMLKTADTMVNMNADTMKQSCELKAIGKRIDMECSLKSL